MQWSELFNYWWLQVTEDLENRYWPSVDEMMDWADSHPDAMLFIGLLIGIGLIVFFVGWWVGVMYVPPHARQTLAPLPEGLTQALLDQDKGSELETQSPGAAQVPDVPVVEGVDPLAPSFSALAGALPPLDAWQVQGTTTGTSHPSAIVTDATADSADAIAPSVIAGSASAMTSAATAGSATAITSDVIAGSATAITSDVSTNRTTVISSKADTGGTSVTSSDPGAVATGSSHGANQGDFGQDAHTDRTRVRAEPTEAGQSDLTPSSPPLAVAQGSGKEPILQTVTVPSSHDPVDQNQASVPSSHDPLDQSQASVPSSHDPVDQSQASVPSSHDPVDQNRDSGHLQDKNPSHNHLTPISPVQPMPALSTEVEPNQVITPLSGDATLGLVVTLQPEPALGEAADIVPESSLGETGPPLEETDADAQFMREALEELSDVIQQTAIDEDALEIASEPLTPELQIELDEPVLIRTQQPEAFDDLAVHEAVDADPLPHARPWCLSNIEDLKALDARLGRAHGRAPSSPVRVAAGHAREFAVDPGAPVPEIAEMAAPEPLFPSRGARALPESTGRAPEPPLRATPAMALKPVSPTQPPALDPAVGSHGTPVDPPQQSPVSPTAQRPEEPSYAFHDMPEDEELLPEVGPQTESPRVADFQLKLDVSAQDLAEVGLPLQIEAPVVDQALPVPPRIAALTDLTSEHLLLVARYCLWRGDSAGAREAIAPILSREDSQQRRSALALLDGH